MPARDRPAWCPLCRRRIPTFGWAGRTIFEHHTAGLAGPVRAPVCDASGWLVEDEDRVAS